MAKKDLKNKPFLVLSAIEPGTSGDLSFVNKMIDSYQGRNQGFIVVLNDMGAPNLEEHALVECLKQRPNVTVQITSSTKFIANWTLEENIKKYEPQAIIYGPSIVLADHENAQIVALKNKVPFVTVPEYSIDIEGPKVVHTGPRASNSGGMFLKKFPKKEINPADANKIGNFSNKEVFFSYLNNHSTGSGTNPRVFVEQQLSYLYFVTSLMANYREDGSRGNEAEVFARFNSNPQIFEQYIKEIQAQNPYGLPFQITFEGKVYNIDASSLAPIKINFSDPFPLKQDSVISLLQTCKEQGNPVCVTGDQSLSEAISVGGPFLYQAMPWKISLRKELQQTANLYNLSMVEKMQARECLAYKNLAEADILAKNYVTNRVQLIKEFASFGDNIPVLYDTLPQQVDLAIKRNSFLQYKKNNRFHFHPVDSTKLYKKYKDLKGGALKLEILADFQIQLMHCKNSFELEETLDFIKSSKEYKTLTKRQGILAGGETSSVKEFNKIVEEVRSHLESSTETDLAPKNRTPL